MIARALLRKIHHHIEQIKLLPELYNLKDNKINVKSKTGEFRKAIHPVHQVSSVRLNYLQ
jgi:hypothetical protein